ncbi:MAG: hypothetical protein IPK73_02705 [Candidatus Obscuribacter sp.]|nr:hypothetical protein [Candidatus Obscuribacter sp.]HMY51432.1 hypothetical protein [Candidatus Obscuribacter sp.]HND06841.1 hypothetical protein [Candidatus Obscuribacter sp.]HNG74768.1 hypothetical protein [Candidatus Obscuribacter sp.]HNH75486.1 hypothetical protein [Candidatus Obscuribacter sp.]
MPTKSTSLSILKPALSCLVCLACALWEPAAGQEANMQTLEKAYQDGNLKAAAGMAKELIGKNRNNLTARYYLGNIYTKLGLAHEAMSEYAYCVNFGKDSQVAGYAREAMKSIDQVLSDRPPTAVGKQTAGGAGAGNTSKTALQLKTELLTRGSQEVEDLKEKHRQAVAALKKETDAKAAPYLPPSLRNWDKGISPREQLAITDDPNYRHFLELQIELSEKIYKLNQKLNDDIERVNESYKRRVEAIDQYGGTAAAAQAQILPEQGGTLRNYVNYGKDEEIDTIPVTGALTATPASLEQGQKQKPKTPTRASKKQNPTTSRKKAP